MTRIFYLVNLLLLIPIITTGQCPTLTLSSTSGNTCGITSVSVSNNYFGGNATRVTITDNGRGSVHPVTAASSPFTFTYTPEDGDVGRNILITVTTNNPSRKHCTAATSTYILTVNTLPSAPGTGTINQPTCVTQGRVVLNGLPSDGRWTISRTPIGSTISGEGTSATFSGLATGRYNFRVTNSTGCTSGLSEDVVIGSAPPAPAITITDPAPVCSPSTVDLTSPQITEGSSPGLTYTYWRNSAATVNYNSPAKATEGTYYIKGTVNETGCFNNEPVTVTVWEKPESNAGPDKVLDYQFATKMEASGPGDNETGKWSVLSGSGLFSDYSDPDANVSKLSLGNNTFLWTITNGVCPPSSDLVSINVKDLVIPTLITPNMDGRNDYFVITKNEILGRIELTIFDRRGVQVYQDLNYENNWNGIDLDGNPLPEDTYFYFANAENGRTLKGYIVIRR